jgi:hypothetical protein
LNTQPATLEVNINVEDTFIFPNERRIDERWGLAMEYLKDRVERPVLENLLSANVFENDAVRLVMSSAGFFYEFNAMKESFFGSTRPITLERLSDDEARSTLWDAISLYRSGEGRVMVIYGPNYRDDYRHIFLGHYLGFEPIEKGELKLEMPLFFRVDVDSMDANVLVGGAKGVAFFVRTRAGENILIRVPQATTFSGVMNGVRD